jgi:hypothetical protein
VLVFDEPAKCCNVLALVAGGREFLKMKAIVGVILAMSLAGLAACAGAYVAGDSGARQHVASSAY